ncbi:MAG: hypothetical protein M3Q06_12730, partial [Bacteroidota bacterium]|nr:hypothetical protein [Bacteroidota bacterium]
AFAYSLVIRHCVLTITLLQAYCGVLALKSWPIRQANSDDHKDNADCKNNDSDQNTFANVLRRLLFRYHWCHCLNWRFYTAFTEDVPE